MRLRASTALAALNVATATSRVLGSEPAADRGNRVMGRHGSTPLEADGAGRDRAARPRDQPRGSLPSGRRTTEE
ncbi:MAG: hypothetical protein AVDCRST_MAG49-1456 [uncultured Thermomicrobiales bacterium]|uniref:Uncharacterized protein n=1 Tax=uncultured Thermomicrobiales bacterium TaxID=1645740 RepID=A0A6J4UEG0_9BACT|nr:MAG: hypothetical protein AVDCRST_MAG49-1456 [uncultured Thermomicrobiales bacterium]